jgi:hypothetical protein
VDRAGALCLEPGDDAQQRRLAAARRAEEADELAVADVERDLVQGDEAAEVLADAGERQEWRRSSLTRSRRGPGGRGGAARVRAPKPGATRGSPATGYFFGSDFES